jgi:hypothetical protein
VGPLALCVDPVAHCDEICRFQGNVVAGRACMTVRSSLAPLVTTGTGFALRRGESVRVVPAARYALALALDGNPLPAELRAASFGIQAMVTHSAMTP